MQLVGQDLLACLVLAHRLACPTERPEQVNGLDMRLFAQRVEIDPRPRVGERFFRRVSTQPCRERRDNARAQHAERLSLGNEPLVKAVAVGQVETLEQIAAEDPRRLPERVDRRCADSAREERAHLNDIDLRAVSLERDAIARSNEACRARVVDQRPEFP